MMSANIVIRRMGRTRAAALGMCAWLICGALPAYAANVLQQVSQAQGPKGGVEITLQFADPVGDAQVFTTDNPPRIAIDLPDTRDGMPVRSIPIGNGAASSVSAVEANGRTRVVVDLFRPAAYESRIEGNRLIVSVAGNGAVAQAPTGSKGPVLANTQDPSRRVVGALSVSNIDFRRAANGAGRVILRFSGNGADADMHTEGTRVMVDVGNAMMPTNLAKHMDVSDFATPVQSLDVNAHSGGSRFTINTAGAFESMAYQSGNEYVVEISPKAAAKNGNAASDENRIGGGTGKAAYKGKPATFNFQDVPVRTVLQLIAEESNLNIVAADTVSGNLTLRLINVPWDQALDIVLRAKSLDKRQDGNVIWVAPQKELADYEQATQDARIALEQRVDTVTEYIPINYGNAADIAKLLTDDAKNSQSGGGGAGVNSQRGFLSPRGSVSFDQRTNTLLVIDIPKKVAEIKQLISLLDRPVDQVLIEARIVIANQSFARDLGARLGLSGAHEGGSAITTYGGSLESTLSTNQSVVSTALSNAALMASYNASIAALGPNPTQQQIDSITKPVLNQPTITRGLNVNLPTPNPSGSLAFTILNGGHLLDLELSAMQTEGKGQVISNPRVITSNQKEADIKQGDEVGYVTTTGGGSTGGTNTPNVQFKDVLLELRVTPTITSDNRVYMNLDVKKDEISGFVNTSIGSVPQIAKREVTTAVLVDSGQTVVIGGVYEFKSQEDLNKVPFLGDLPGLGALFRSKNKSESKAELLIFVTPKILQVRPRSG